MKMKTRARNTRYNRFILGNGAARKQGVRVTPGIVLMCIVRFARTSMSFLDRPKSQTYWVFACAVVTRHTQRNSRIVSVDKRLQLERCQMRGRLILLLILSASLT